MRKVILFVQVSLDGFFEGPKKEIDWHMVDDELHTHVNEVLKTAGGFLSGRVTYELMAGFWPTADADPASTPIVKEFAQIWREMPKVVYSRKDRAMRVLIGVAGVVFLGSSALAQTDAQALGCASGRLEDCRQLLLLVEVKRGTEPGLEETFAPVFNKARAVFVAACDRGDASDSGCFGAGMMHTGNRPDGLARAVTFYERSCDGGYAAGCTQLGNAYTSGVDLDVPWDPQRALAAYERACSAGDPGGCSIVAKVLEGAADIPASVLERVPRDLKRAASLYQKACDMGAMPDCLRLAEMYEGGVGVGKDAARAGRLYARACEGGVKDACGRGGTSR